MHRPLFTVFTPSYNRRHTLPRVFAALQAQTSKDFEWVVVDDGSTDGTELLLPQFTQAASFPIRYFQQENGGKHTALNRGVAEARGELFLPLDSDDTCVPETIETFARRWAEIPQAKRSDFSGITCHCMDEAGKLIGPDLGCDYFDGNPFDAEVRRRIKGEKWGFHRTEVLRMYPFPTYPGEKSVPEGIVWDKIGAAYKLRYINSALRIYFQSEDGWMTHFVRRSTRSPNAYADYHLQRLTLPLPARERFKALASQTRYCLHAGRMPQVNGKHFVLDRLLMVPAALLGAALWIRDHYKLRSDKSRS